MLKLQASFPNFFTSQQLLSALFDMCFRLSELKSLPHSVTMYADDTSISYSSSSLVDIEQTLDSELNDLKL